MSNNIKIGYGNLMQADIIVSTTNHSTSKMIRAATGGTVSHALIYTGQHTIVEAITSGVREVPIGNAIGGDTILAIALRYNGLTQAQRQQIVDNARKFLKLGYDHIGAAGSGMGGGSGLHIAVVGCSISQLACAAGAAAVANNSRDKNADKAFFCSELVARAFELAGAKLVDARPSFTNPRMVHESSTLRYVGHLRGA